MIYCSVGGLVIHRQPKSPRRIGEDAMGAWHCMYRRLTWKGCQRSTYSSTARGIRASVSMLPSCVVGLRWFVDGCPEIEREASWGSFKGFERATPALGELGEIIGYRRLTIAKSGECIDVSGTRRAVLIIRNALCIVRVLRSVLIEAIRRRDKRLGWESWEARMWRKVWERKGLIGKGQGNKQNLQAQGTGYRIQHGANCQISNTHRFPSLLLGP